MKPIRISIECDDGSVSYIDDVAIIRKIGLAIIPLHLSWTKSANIATLRNKYFQMLTELAKKADTGQTKADLHEALKPLLLGKFVDFPQFFTTGKFEQGTRYLTREGWIAIIEQLKSVAADIYGYVFL